MAPRRRRPARRLPKQRAEAARAVIAAADEAGVLAYGSYKTVTELLAVANSHGIAATEERTHGPPDHGVHGSRRRGRLRRAGRRRPHDDRRRTRSDARPRKAAQAGKGPVAIEPGDYPVVLEEYAVVDLLDMLGYLGFSALAVQEERSFFEPGKRIGSRPGDHPGRRAPTRRHARLVRLRGRRQAAR